MSLFSVNTFTIELVNKDLKRVLPLSFMDRLEFAAVAGEMVEYIQEMSKVQQSKTFNELLSSDKTLQNYIQLLLDMVDLRISDLPADSVLGLLFPYEDADGEKHTRGLLFEKNFPDSPEVGNPVSENDVKEMLYQRLAELSLHFESFSEALRLAQDVPAQILEEVATRRSKLLKDAQKTDKERYVEKGKKQAKEDLMKILTAGGNPET